MVQDFLEALIRMFAYEYVQACDNFISYVCVRVRTCRPVIAQDFLEALKVVRPYSAMPQKQRGRHRFPEVCALQP